jgi:hypothetical protein
MGSKIEDEQGCARGWGCLAKIGLVRRTDLGARLGMWWGGVRGHLMIGHPNKAGRMKPENKSIKSTIAI